MKRRLRSKAPTSKAGTEMPERLIDGKDIRHMRIDLEIDQAELAKEMGIAAATLSRIENNKSSMSRPYYKLLRYTIRSIEERTGKNVSYVFKE